MPKQEAVVEERAADAVQTEEALVSEPAAEPVTEPENPYAIEEPLDDEEIPSGDETKGVEEKVADAATQEPEPEVEQGLLDEAESLGYSRELAEELGKAGLLERALGDVDRRAELLGRQKEAPPAAAEEQVQAPPAEDAYKIVLEGDEYDPEVVKALQGMNAHYAGQMAQVRSELKGALTKLEEQQIERQNEQFDARLAGLGDEYTDLLGKEPLSKLNRGGEQYANRLKLLETMDVLSTGYEQMGRDVPDSTLFQRALRTQFGDTIATQERKKIAGQLDKQKGQMIARPTKRRVDEALPADVRALRALSTEMRDKRLTEDTAEPDQF